MSNSHYEKIALSAYELRYVYGQIYNRAKEWLDKHLPQEGGDNEFKNMVFEDIGDLLVEGFDLAKHSMLIDGKEVEHDPISDVLKLHPKEIIAPLDLSINSELRKVILQVEQKTIEVTKLRRELPEHVRQAYDDLTKTVDLQVSNLLDEIDNVGEEEDFVDDKIPKFEDLDSMIDDYEQHIFLLNELKQSVPRCRSELDKVDETIEFLERANQSDNGQNSER